MGGDMSKKTALKRLVLVQGDITKEKVDAIANAANSGLRGGGGVDGAIHRAGGPSIMEECRKIGHCPTGKAVVTGAGKLPAKYVIHTVGPIWSGGKENEDELLASCYRESLKIASEKAAKTVAFPSISTGVYGFPIDRAARIALKTILEGLEKHPDIQEVRMVLFSEGDLATYRRALEEIRVNSG